MRGDVFLNACSFGTFTKKLNDTIFCKIIPCPWTWEQNPSWSATLKPVFCQYFERPVCKQSITIRATFPITDVYGFFRESAKRAGIQKHVSTHCLRHSFASHLFESGCDVKYIQALLGHRDPKSTEVYLHVSNKTLLGIRSPFDEMGGEWLWRNHVRYKMYLNGFILLMKRGIALLLIIEKQLIISWTVKQALLV